MVIRKGGEYMNSPFDDTKKIIQKIKSKSC